jgi:uncharacterized membrane protein YfcA
MPGDRLRPRNGLGTVTFVVMVLGGLLAVFPATAGFGFLLCLLALVLALRRRRAQRRRWASRAASCVRERTSSLR